MIYGYLRVSSDAQDVNSQKQGVEQFAKDKGWQIEQYITDEGVSGGKDPDKRNLGPLLKKLKKEDVVIASEISRLGRDLYMVMDILHFCMKQEVVIYTVKDRFVLGDDIQSKVLAFAFGLAAEIERQMIRQRTTEGLRMRMKMGILLGRPFGNGYEERSQVIVDNKEDILKALEFGAAIRSIAQKLEVNRNTLSRYLTQWGYKGKGDKEYQALKKRQQHADSIRKCSYKDTPYCVVELPRKDVVAMIEQDLTIPKIAERLPQFTYEQIYDTFTCDREYNNLYRQHAQKKLVKKK